MHGVKIAAVLVLVLIMMTYIRGGLDFPLPRVLPFAGGHAPSALYDGAALAAVAITIWGILRVLGRGKPADEDADDDDTDA